MARNIQLILKEEAYFDKVSDPAAGAYYIEDLTNKIVEEAWAFFMEIEANGGYINSLKNNFIQSKINENKQLLIEQLNSGQKTFLGVNKYPSTLEQWVEVRPETISGIEFEPLNEFILEAYYQKPTK
jgi:methylmalonyl-CoA mutase